MTVRELIHNSMATLRRLHPDPELIIFITQLSDTPPPQCCTSVESPVDGAPVLWIRRYLRFNCEILKKKHKQNNYKLTPCSSNLFFLPYK